jgi:NACHT domain
LTTIQPEQSASQTRLWAPVGEPAVFDDAGFIASPGDLFPPQNPAVVAVGHLDPLRCVVVLGEPGIGKSTLLKAEYERAREAHTRTLWVDLGAFDDSRQLSEQIFEDAVWSTTSSDDDEVVLFLDGLDEAWLRLPTVSDLLVRELAAVDTASLQLRLSCRPAQWPASLGDELSRLWPDAPPVIRNLLPLQRSEVANMARAAELDGDAFVTDVVRLGIAALAGHPLTLSC